MLGLRLLTLDVSVLHSVGGKFHRQLWPGKTVFFGRPRAEVGDLAAFGAERAPRIPFPRGRSITEGAQHAAF